MRLKPECSPFILFPLDTTEFLLWSLQIVLKFGNTILKLFRFGHKVNYKILYLVLWFSGGSVVNNLPANAGDAGSIPGSGRSAGEENGSLLQYTCPGNLMDRGALWAAVHGVAKDLVTEHTHIYDV